MRTVEQFLLLLLGIVLVLLCWQPLEVGSDFWAHAAVGRWIVEHRAVPRGALFLWTYGGPWLAHSWLSEVACYGLMRVGGEWGGPVLAVSLTALVALATLGAALWPVVREYKRLPLIVAASTFLAVLCCMNRFVPRPEVLTTLCTVCLYAIVANAREGVERGDPAGKRKPLLIGLPLLFAVWTNLHGAVIYGLVALWIAALCDSWQYRDSLARTLLAAAALSTAAMLVNPYGARYLLIYAPLARHSFYYIGEWMPFWVKPRLDVKVPIYELALLLAALTVWISKPKRRWSHLAWLVVAVASFIQARRNMDLLALTALTVIARDYSAAAASEWVRDLTRDQARLRTWRVAGALGTGALLLNLLWMSGVLLACQSGGSFVSATRSALPVTQASVVRALASPRLHALNLYNSAAYLEWRMAGSVPLYIDGLNAYPDGVYRTWRQMWDGTPAGLAAFDRSGINCVMANHIAPNSYAPNLINHLAANPDWLLIYDGSDGAVLVRRDLLTAVAAGAPPATRLSPRRTAT